MRSKYTVTMSLHEAAVLKGAAGYGVEPSKSEQNLLERVIRRIERTQERAIRDRSKARRTK